MMPKRTIAEWVTVAKISRDVGHLFFEGPTDARVIAHSAGYPKNVDFRSADEIADVGERPSALLGGNKLRLMELSRKSAQHSCSNIKCVVDSDFSVLVSHLYRNSCLLETEFANLPVSTLTFKWLQGFLLKGYGATLDQDGWDALCSILKFAFVVRFVSASSDNPAKAPSLASFLAVKKSVLVFDADGYVRTFLNKHGHNLSEAVSRVEGVADWLFSDIRHLANSNDVFELLYIYLKKTGKIPGSFSEEAIRRAYFAAIDDNVFAEPGFEPLRNWIAIYDT